MLAKELQSVQTGESGVGCYRERVALIEHSHREKGS
jgi:hypothetical protein